MRTAVTISWTDDRVNTFVSLSYQTDGRGIFISFMAVGKEWCKAVIIIIYYARDVTLRWMQHGGMVERENYKISHLLALFCFVSLGPSCQDRSDCAWSRLEAALLCLHSLFFIILWSLFRFSSSSLLTRSVSLLFLHISVTSLIRKPRTGSASSPVIFNIDMVFIDVVRRRKTSLTVDLNTHNIQQHWIQQLSTLTQRQSCHQRGIKHQEPVWLTCIICRQMLQQYDNIQEHESNAVSINTYVGPLEGFVYSWVSSLMMSTLKGKVTKQHTLLL